MVIGDEMLTPDSSRFWPADGYEAGHGQPSFDKQFARDWLKENKGHDWTLPQEIVDKTIDKYLQAYKMLSLIHISFILIICSFASFLPNS